VSDQQHHPSAATSTHGLDAVLFDMDGVITDTAEAHAAAWKQLFDAFLEARATDLQPFDIDADYRDYVDGKPRYDGVASFLASRGIELPYGSEEDDPDAATICGLGNRKNRYFNAWLKEHRVRAYPGSIALVQRLRRAGLRLAVFSASRNAEAVLQSAGVLDRFDVKVDGSDMAELGLPGKPDPAILLRATQLLGVAPSHTAVVEDAVAGVQAGVAGGFAQTIGVDREGRGERLLEAGAAIVVADLGELALDETGRLVRASPRPVPVTAAKTGSPAR
jgi:beta-phosphoglucomutase family hydrolase